MSSVTVKVRIKLNKAADVVPNVERGTESALDRVANATLASDTRDCPVDTGRLKLGQAIFSAKLVRQVGSNVPYHIYVHEGTYKMGARPFTTNAFEENQAMLPADCAKIKVV